MLWFWLLLEHAMVSGRAERPVFATRLVALFCEMVRPHRVYFIVYFICNVISQGSCITCSSFMHINSISEILIRSYLQFHWNPYCSSNMGWKCKSPIWLTDARILTFRWSQPDSVDFYKREKLGQFTALLSSYITLEPIFPIHRQRFSKCVSGVYGHPVDIYLIIIIVQPRSDFDQLACP